MTSSGHSSQLLQQLKCQLRTWCAFFVKYRAWESIFFFQNCALWNFSLPLALLKSYFISIYTVSARNSAGILSQSSSTCIPLAVFSLPASASLSLWNLPQPLWNLPETPFCHPTQPWVYSVPLTTSVQLLITLYYLKRATNHHLSLLAKADHFILNTDGTRSELICKKSKLSRCNTCSIIGKRALILSIVGHEKKSELNIQQYVRKQMVFSSFRDFISISADLSVASLNSWARLFCWTCISVQILKTLLKDFAKDRK